MDVLLVHYPAPLGEEIAEHIGIGYMAAILRQDGMRVTIVDAVLFQISLKKLTRIICDYFSRYRFLLLGISAYENNYKEFGTFISSLRLRGMQAHITIGGHFPTIEAEEILKHIPNLDSICRGEGEYTIRNLARCLKEGKDWRNISNLCYRQNKRKIVSNKIKPIERLDLLPYPSRDTVQHLKAYGAPIGVLRSRGCWASCTFCSIATFYKICGAEQYRVRDAKDVIEEIEHILARYHYNRIRFLDDTFVSTRPEDKDNAIRLAKGLIQRNCGIRFHISTRCDAVEREIFFLLKQAGLEQVYLGLESWSNESLDRFNKHIDSSVNRNACDILKSLELKFHVGFIMFDPYSTLSDIRQNIEGIKNHLEKGLHLHSPKELYRRLRLFRGTPIVDILEREGLLKKLPYLRLDYNFKYSDTQRFYEVIKTWRCCIEPTQKIYKHLRILSQRPFIPGNLKINIERANHKWLTFQIDQFEKFLDCASNHHGESVTYNLDAEKVLKRNLDHISEFHDNGLVLLSNIYSINTRNIYSCTN